MSEQRREWLREIMRSYEVQLPRMFLGDLAKSGGGFPPPPPGFGDIDPEDVDEQKGKKRTVTRSGSPLPGSPLLPPHPGFGDIDPEDVDEEKGKKRKIRKAKNP